MMTDYNKALTLIEEQQKTMKKGSAPWCVGEQLKQIIDDLKDREIMRRRYLLGEKWRQVAESVGLDERWVRRIHHHIVCNIDYYRKMVRTNVKFKKVIENIT